MGLRGAGGVKNFSVGICDGAPSTARSSFAYLGALSNNFNDNGQNRILGKQNHQLHTQTTEETGQLRVYDK